MDWVVLLHVLVAFAFVAGLVGRDITIADRGWPLAFGRWMVGRIARPLRRARPARADRLPASGRVFDAALADAKQRGELTPELTQAFRDPVVALARDAERVVVAVIIGLMVLQPS